MSLSEIPRQSRMAAGRAQLRERVSFPPKDREHFGCQSEPAMTGREPSHEALAAQNRRGAPRLDISSSESLVCHGGIHINSFVSRRMYPVRDTQSAEITRLDLPRVWFSRLLRHCGHASFFGSASRQSPSTDGTICDHSQDSIENRDTLDFVSRLFETHNLEDFRTPQSRSVDKRGGWLSCFEYCERRTPKIDACIFFHSAL